MLMSSKNQNKTAPTGISVEEFLETVENTTRRSDATTAIEMMSRLSGCEPKMWGPSIIGFGSYHYRYESGREGDAPLIGFSPRKANLVFYIMSGYENSTEQLARLGKHRIGKACLYINKLADVDQSVLEEMITECITHMKANFTHTLHPVGGL